MFKTKLFLVLIISLFSIVGVIGFLQHPAVAQENGFSTNGGSSIIQISQISLKTNDLIYDPVGNKIYASIPGTVPNIGNSVTPINPSNLAVGSSIFVGSEPNKLAISDDGQYLYVGINGAGAIRRVNVISQTAEIQFSLGSGFCGTYLAEDMVVLPGIANSVAVSKRNTGCSPRHEGVAIYDDGVQRPTTTPGHTGSNKIEPSGTSDVLYGYNNESTEFGFRVMAVITEGVQVSSTKTGLISGFGQDIRFDAGLVYATTGAVIDPINLTLVGTYPASGLVQPDSTSEKVYFLQGNQFKIFDQDTFVLQDSFPISGVSGQPSSLIKVGENSFAFRTTEEQVFLIKFIDLTESLYLPVVANPVIVIPPQGIYGQVTENGTPIANIFLELRFYNGSSWSTFTSTNTDAEGRYSFLNIPSLGPGQMYYVLYSNTNFNLDHLWVWGTRVLASYSLGSTVEIGNFDIADITLLSPPHGTNTGLPITFQWLPRLATPSDSYEFNLYDFEDKDPYFFTNPPLGYVGEYTLNGLPNGFDTDVWYVWDVWVYGPDGGFGISYTIRYIAFASGSLENSIISNPIPRTPAQFPEDMFKR